MKVQIHKPTNNQINTSMARRSFLRLSSELASVVPVAALARGYSPIHKPPIEREPVNTEVPHHIGVSDTTAVPIKPFKVYEATLPAVDLKPVKQVDYYSSSDPLYIAEDVLFQSLNFSGTVPGPVLVLNQGDEVQFSLTNKSVLPHSIDFHAALTPPSKNYISIMPGDTQVQLEGKLPRRLRVSLRHSIRASSYVHGYVWCNYC
jgi:FtsP/CotA-like multicopper oxidase with cupredoxin domain